MALPPPSRQGEAVVDATQALDAPMEHAPLRVETVDEVDEIEDAGPDRGGDQASHLVDRARERRRRPAGRGGSQCRGAPPARRGDGGRTARRSTQEGRRADRRRSAVRGASPRRNGGVAPGAHCRRRQGRDTATPRRRVPGAGHHRGSSIRGAQASIGIGLRARLSLTTRGPEPAQAAAESEPPSADKRESSRHRSNGEAQRHRRRARHRGGRRGEPHSFGGRGAVHRRLLIDGARAARRAIESSSTRWRIGSAILSAATLWCSTPPRSPVRPRTSATRS